MPPKKKQGRVSNKKNKGQRANAGSATNRSSSGRTTNHSQHQDLLRSITNVPVFHSTGQESAKPSRSNNYYGIYKQATTRFWNWMKQALPENKMTAINDLWKGADQLLEHNIALLQMPPPPPPIVVPPGIMADLSRSIRYRTFVAETKFGTSAEGEDEGHRYIIEVLRYCRKKLRYGRGVAKLVLADAMEEAVGADEDEVAANHIGGRFNALLMEDNDEDEDEVMEQIEKDIRERNFPEMEAPKAAKKEDEEMDIQKALINGDDRFQAMALLHTMDDWMGVVDGHYGLLKNAMRDQDSRDGSVLQLLMECAEVVNLATQSVHEAEQALALAHPRLSSFYRVLALVFLPHFVAEVEAMLNKTPKEKQEHDLALEFVAEVIECAFHNMGDDKVPGKVKRFAQRTGIKFKEQLNQTAQEINMLASLEVQLHQEEALNTSRNALILAQAGLRPHQWLQQSIHIGGDRCLLNTQCLVQKLMGIVREETKLVGKRGFWGPEFNEMRPARRIRGDLDEVFAANIMPELMEICFRAPFSCLPDRPQLITVLELMQQYINKDRTSPVPVALTFGLHAVLTSIFVLQGDGDLARIATYTKQSYNTLFSQLDKISEPSRPPENAPNFYKNVAIFKNLVNFAKPVPCHYDPNLLSVDPETSEKMAFWNPVIGGEYMLYSTYVCSINLGSATVDSLGQLRFTLHLYNALLNCEGDQGRSLQSISFLRTVDKAFTRTKAVWPAGKPQKGSYSKNFWIAWGVEATEAARMASRPSSDDDSQVIQNVKQRSSANTVRKLDELRPEEYSASFRRIVLQDFQDDGGVEEYTVRKSTEELQTNEFKGLQELLIRVNMTRDSMDEDEDIVLPVNFSAVGVILLEFKNALAEHMGWNEIIKKVVENCPEGVLGTGKTMGGQPMRPGSFNASDLNVNHQGLAHCLAHQLKVVDHDLASIPFDIKKAAAFMSDFFKDIPKERYIFFVESENDPRVTRRNPLEGSYPYGRTGRTPRDPLQGFMHFKYSKKGTPVVRLIKPGKFTPFYPTETGDAANPYQETGSKLERQPNGKYRHIASHRLDELIALGWDGATYTSAKGKHEAVGLRVPFIVGYDSDSDDEYERIDVTAGKLAGTVGLSPEEKGSYMAIPNMGRPGERQLVRIQK